LRCIAWLARRYFLGREAGQLKSQATKSTNTQRADAIQELSFI
jgi:chorismate mutase